MNPIQHSHWWKDDSTGELIPTWIRTPDLSIIRDLAIQNLPQDFANVQIKFFAEGAFNKLYNIWSSQNSRQYIMRITLPVEPFYKTESESATLAYIRKHTSISVPNVVAYDSNHENPLGFEWMLLEKIDGVPLSDVWERMDFKSKTKLSKEIAQTIQQLSNLRFRKIGSLYFSEVQNQLRDRKPSSDSTKTKDSIMAHSRTLFKSSDEADNALDVNKGIQSSYTEVKIDQDIGAKFVVGPIVSPWFFRDKRVLLPADRGPFLSSYTLMLAKAQIQIERIKNLSPLSTDEYYSESDEELMDDQDEILKICDDLKTLIADYFSPLGNDKDTNTLYHSDLSDQNIIVDPNTYCITGIVDWESVSICPSWETCDYPYFLKGAKVEEPPPLGDSDVDEENLTAIRKDWEKVLLRREYMKSFRDVGKGLNGIPLIPEIMSDSDIKYKRYIASLLYQIESRWTAAKHWIPYLQSKNFDYIDEFATGL